MNEAIQNMDPMHRANYEACGKAVDFEVSQGRDLEQILLEKMRTQDSRWYCPNMLRHFSTAVAGMFKTTGFVESLEPWERSSYALSARYVDEEVAKGRQLDEVLEECWTTMHGGKRHFDPEALRHFSTAVADSFKTSPIPLRMSQPMRLALEAEARNSKVPRSEVMRQLLQEALDARAKNREGQEAGGNSSLTARDREIFALIAREIAAENKRA